MHLMYYEAADGSRVYTLDKAYMGVDEDGKPALCPTLSAHPARFTPDDVFSRSVIIGRRLASLC